ncbi:hypothetical protein [Mycolicibacterium holsaticum]|jgi:hypothetical protein|uniref:Uncharacterized protein n=1 Tax=Mycolicibacterium holsaticum TaxID=152142 RepID=A0A1E3RX34_9MYCO|nr:hypothetical protein [Mycolicibacterium holsaticum]MDA4110091.1 membrane protein [Mycolicibacterium holsaticum DSM 44478 = JCM 12374]ODQ94483.1 hypothetical protein BHQ17_08795 [Mycolicibacterium holsaticum]QZA11997.1 hypothetical protein K3U96_23040 [Mycolicibacterium holsaticum DSM 44478 = JCM 12374]UNC10517.1 hypothetical protein H5U41_03775 [Mycolicibacterium holsaticum DSM 44478 = JCM 12374]
MTAAQPRPTLVSAAFWCWVGAAVMLMVGGLLTASVNLPTVFRAGGVVTVVVGAAMAFLAGRSRKGDTRFRRAAVALALVTAVWVGLTAALGVVHLLTLLAILPLIAGAVLMTRRGEPMQEDIQ